MRLRSAAVVRDFAATQANRATDAPARTDQAYGAFKTISVVGGIVAPNPSNTSRKLAMVDGALIANRTMTAARMAATINKATGRGPWSGESFMGGAQCTARFCCSAFVAMLNLGS